MASKTKSYYVFCHFYACGKRVREIETVVDDEGNCYCPKCAADLTAICLCCGKTKYQWEMSGTSYCGDCAVAIV